MFLPFLIAVGLNFDTFSVTIIEGAQAIKATVKNSMKVGLFFGFAQAFLAFGGYLLGYGFRMLVGTIDHWIAFVLLSLIGSKLLMESKKIEECGRGSDLNFRSLFFLSIATSIDALAVGITFAFLKQSIVTNVLIIFAVTFVVSFIGYHSGKQLKKLCRGQAKAVGGILLLLIGLKILLEHLFFGR